MNIYYEVIQELFGKFIESSMFIWTLHCYTIHEVDIEQILHLKEYELVDRIANYTGKKEQHKSLSIMVPNISQIMLDKMAAASRADLKLHLQV